MKVILKTITTLSLLMAGISLVGMSADATQPPGKVVNYTPTVYGGGGAVATGSGTLVLSNKSTT